MWPFKRNKSDQDNQPFDRQKAATEAAMAQYRATRAELGEETIQAMQKAINFEQARQQIRDSIDGKNEHTIDHVLMRLQDLVRENRS